MKLIMIQSSNSTDLNVPNDECDNYNPTPAIVAAVTASTLIVIVVVIACIVTCIMRRGNRRKQGERLHVCEKEMYELADRTDDAETKEQCRQSAKEYGNAARRRLETDEGDLQKGAIDNPTQPGSTSDDGSAITN